MIAGMRRPGGRRMIAGLRRWPVGLGACDPYATTASISLNAMIERLTLMGLFGNHQTYNLRPAETGDTT